MGIMCSNSRRENHSESHNHCQLKMTMIPAYDKVYQQYQYYVEDYEQLKLNYERVRANLVKTGETEILTPNMCLDAIVALIRREQTINDQKLLKIQDKFPYIVLETNASSELMANLSPALKFLNVLEHTKNELSRFKLLFENGKAKTRDFILSFQIESHKAGLDDFDRILGREIAKNNNQKLRSLAVECHSYLDELSSIDEAIAEYFKKEISFNTQNKPEGTIISLS